MFYYLALQTIINTLSFPRIIYVTCILYLHILLIKFVLLFIILLFYDYDTSRSYYIIMLVIYSHIITDHLLVIYLFNVITSILYNYYT